MALVTINKVEIVRKGNPAEKLVAYVTDKSTLRIDSLLIRQLIPTRLKTAGGSGVHGFKMEGGRVIHTDDAGKSALGY